jgi:hypothetical protein
MTGPRTPQSFIRIWRWPFALGLSITFGLLSALLGQGGIWWGLSWIALSVPLLVVALCAYGRGHAASSRG